MKWFVLGFSYDDVVTCWQDSRLAQECVRAWQSAGCPPDFAVLQASGEGLHMTFWYVSEPAARVLDAQHVAWRSFLVGERPAPPEAARDALVGVKSQGV
jgi:hypothetical protein